MPRNRMNPVAQFPTGLPYGRQQQLERQAAALPVPHTAPAPATPAPDPAAQRQAALAGMAQLPVLPPLGRPSDRPYEPVTAGLPVGAGAGPEAMAPLGTPRRSVADLFASLAAATQDPALAAAAQMAQGWR